MKQNVIDYLKHVQSDKKYEMEKLLKAKIIYVGSESNYTIKTETEPKQTLIMKFNSKGPIFENVAGSASFTFNHLDKSKASYLLALHKQYQSIGHTIGVIYKHQLSQNQEPQEGLFEEGLASL